MDILKTSEEINRAIESDQMVLLYFGADSCSVCVDLLPKVEEILKKYPKIKPYYVDAHGSLKVSAEFNVFTVPVISLYIDSKETIREARHISVLSLDEKLERYYNMLVD